MEALEEEGRQEQQSVASSPEQALKENCPAPFRPILASEHPVPSRCKSLMKEEKGRTRRSEKGRERRRTWFEMRDGRSTMRSRRRRRRRRKETREKKQRWPRRMMLTISRRKSSARKVKERREREPASKRSQLETWELVGLNFQEAELSFCSVAQALAVMMRMMMRKLMRRRRRRRGRRRRPHPLLSSPQNEQVGRLQLHRLLAQLVAVSQAAVQSLQKFGEQLLSSCQHLTATTSSPPGRRMTAKALRPLAPTSRSSDLARLQLASASVPAAAENRYHQGQEEQSLTTSAKVSTELGGSW